MPVKRRSDKRRLDPVAELMAWECVFDCSHDFFTELPSIGVATDPYGCPPHEATEAAWHRLGARFLAERQPDPRPPWALQQFGEPNHAR